MEILLKLSDTLKLNVVREWYLKIPEIIQSKKGFDLEEICENHLDFGTDIIEGTIEKLKLSNLDILIVVSSWYKNQTDKFYVENREDEIALVGEKIFKIDFEYFIMKKIQEILF